MTDLDLTEAIHAAAWDLDPIDGMEDEGHEGVAQAIRAAAPVIERQVREHIAADIEAEAAQWAMVVVLDGESENPQQEAWLEAMGRAARIARGGAS